MSDPTIYNDLLAQLRDQIRVHEKEARKARAAYEAVKNLTGGKDPLRKPHTGTGSGVNRKALGVKNRERINEYFEANPGASMWGASKALELTYNTVMRHRKAFHAYHSSGD